MDWASDKIHKTNNSERRAATWCLDDTMLSSVSTMNHYECIQRTAKSERQKVRPARKTTPPCNIKDINHECGPLVGPTTIYHWNKLLSAERTFTESVAVRRNNGASVKGRTTVMFSAFTSPRRNRLSNTYFARAKSTAGARQTRALGYREKTEFIGRPSWFSRKKHPQVVFAESVTSQLFYGSFGCFEWRRFFNA